ncbi:hypothetical protein QJS66_19795 [Kocuria rhizophila]|nr:hypothetical protein QJS66_19795 [Kocuria rhizophila]
MDFSALLQRPDRAADHQDCGSRAAPWAAEDHCGSQHATSGEKFARDKKLKVREFEVLDRMFSALRRWVKAVLPETSPRSPGGRAPELRLVQTVDADENLGIAVKKGNAVLDAVNRTLDRVTKDGTVDRLGRELMGVSHPRAHLPGARRTRAGGAQRIPEGRTEMTSTSEVRCAYHRHAGPPRAICSGWIHSSGRYSWPVYSCSCSCMSVATRPRHRGHAHAVLALLLPQRVREGAQRELGTEYGAEDART